MDAAYSHMARSVHAVPRRLELLLVSDPYAPQHSSRRVTTKLAIVLLRNS